jgi:type I restriction enzyme S subunit
VTKPVAEGGYPLVTGKAIKDRRIDFSVAYNISDDEHQKVIDRSKPERDDVLFANIGNSIGDLVRVQTDRPFSIKNVALFKPDAGKIYPRFLEYFLLSEQVQSFIKGSTRGSAQPFIGLSSLRGFPIALPPMHEQRNIGTFLCVLDDRITLLRETNATLEAIAQALFKSWFVDFDPVRAKQEGRAPEGMDEATAALFPDGFEESELGLVPRGWLISTLQECCTRTESGGTPKRTVREYWNGDIPWLTSGEVHQPIVFDTKEKITELGVKESSAKLWPAGTTVIAMYGATAGEVCQLAEPTTANQACCGLIPRANFRSFLFVSARKERQNLASKASGSAQQNLNKGLIVNHPVIVPSLDLLARYEDVAGSLLA